MKKTKKEMAKIEQDRHKLLASKLLNDEKYETDIEEYKKPNPTLIKAFQEEIIKSKYSISNVYDIDGLRRISNGKGLFPQEIFEVVKPEQLEGKYLFVRIKIDESKTRILFYLDSLLDVFKEDIPQTKKRFRKEQVEALSVWNEKRLRKSFPQIAKELNIKEPTARKRYYKAYELIYGKRFNPEKFEKPKIKKNYLKINCDVCPEKPTCTDLCPDVIEFVEQDTQPYLREILTRKTI